MPWKNGNPPLYTTWREMLRRCCNKKYNQYKDYGGRGIKVCPEWKHSYAKFYSDIIRILGPRPNGATLDRKDNNADYTPTNCRWATRQDQMYNTRVIRKVVVEGKTYIAAELAKKAGLKTDTIIFRVKNYQGVTLSSLLSPTPFQARDPTNRKHAAQKTAEKRKAQTHCKRGHEFTEENTYTTKLGTRLCRKCDALRARGLHK